MCTCVCGHTYALTCVCTYFQTRWQRARSPGSRRSEMSAASQRKEGAILGQPASCGQGGLGEGPRRRRRVEEQIGKASFQDAGGSERTRWPARAPFRLTAWRCCEMFLDTKAWARTNRNQSPSVSAQSKQLPPQEFITASETRRCTLQMPAPDASGAPCTAAGLPGSWGAKGRATSSFERGRPGYCSLANGPRTDTLVARDEGAKTAAGRGERHTWPRAAALAAAQAKTLGSQVGSSGLGETPGGGASQLGAGLFGHR